MMIRNERGGGDPKNVQIASCGFDPSLAGKTLADVTRLRAMDPTLENAAEATLWIVAQGRPGANARRKEEDQEIRN
jgi:N-acyl-D-amino-acid deacylase